MELLSLIGDIALGDGEPQMYAHVVSKYRHAITPKTSAV